MFTFEPHSQMRLTKRCQHILLHNNGHKQHAYVTSICREFKKPRRRHRGQHSVKFKLAVVVHVFQTTQNLFISR